MKQDHVRRSARRLALWRWVDTHGWPRGMMVEELAQGLGVNKRTVYRDLKIIATAAGMYGAMEVATNMLSQLGIL